MATNLKKYKEEISSSPTKTVVPKKAQTKNSKKLSADPTGKSQMRGTSDGFNFLSSLLQATLFFDYFEHVAAKTYVGERIDLKVVKLKSLHPRFYKWAIRCDLAVRALAFIALFTVACVLVLGAVYKVIFK
ncbi:MAG TPA: hypothetical protein VFT87_01005 [Candidatus Saccharimonadales bacterium]|nr:hypothetical protein [Candidatus Saccharimonadales bacterium]